MAIDTIIKNCKLVKPTGIFPLGLGIEGERIVMQSRDEKILEALGREDWLVIYDEDFKSKLYGFLTIAIGSYIIKEEFNNA